MTPLGPDWLTSAAAALSEAVADPVEVIGGWLNPPVAPSIDDRHVVRLIYAYPTDWIASLAHWRDTVEVWQPHRQIVGHEVSKWARLLLAGEPGAVRIWGHPSSEAADGWQQVWSMGRGLGVAGTEFGQINDWLRRVRRHALVGVER